MNNTTPARRPWTDEELGYVESTMDRPRLEVAAALNRSPATITAYRARFKRGWTPTYTPWAAHEDELIRSSPQSTAAALTQMLPGRTLQAVKRRRVDIGAKALPGGGKHAAKPGLRTLLARTCLGCGLLLPGSWFPVRTGINMTPYHISTCKRCRSDKAIARANPDASKRPNASSLAYKRKAQAITVPLADHNRMEYTESDHKVLADPTITTLRKALMLKRTYAAIVTIMHDMGYKSTAGRLGDPEMIQWIIDNPNAESIEDITAALNPPPADPSAAFPVWDWDD